MNASGAHSSKYGIQFLCIIALAGVELDEIRNQEEKIMMEDATSWLNTKNIDEKFNFQG